MKAPRRRPGESSQKHGFRFEKFWADLFGVKPTPGSGNQWHARMDVGDGAILWSLKHTDAESFRMEKKLMREVETAINGPGGVGGSTLPGIAVSLENEVYVTLRAEDFLRLMNSEGAKYIVPSMADQKRSRARLPALLREEE